MARKARSESALDPTAHRGAIVSDRYRLEGTYERLRRALQNGPARSRLDQPLSYWVLPTDRRLPIAFLDRKLGELLDSPLDELMQTPGVGRKKILGFFDLLRRAVKDESPPAPFGLQASKLAEDPVTQRGAGATSNPGAVSEAVWSEWSEAIFRGGFGDHPLGRVAPSLRPLPTVIWRTPLSEYASSPLAEIRTRKTHGEKRVNAIIEVFSAVYEAISTSLLHEELQLDLRPRFVGPVTKWLLQSAEADSRLGLREVRERLAQPLVHQIEIDLGEDSGRLTSERLGLAGDPPTVRKQAERLNVTRARVYQMLDDCGRVLQVRWPEGRWLVAALSDRSASAEARGLIHAVLAMLGDRAERGDA